MEKLIEEWRMYKDSQSKRKENKGKYPHFDKIYNHNDRKIDKYLLKPQKNNFFPFIRNDVTKRRYRGKIVKRKNRPIMYAAHKDSLIYSFYGFKLGKKYKEILENKELDKDIIAYRSIKKKSGEGKSNIDFAKEVFDFIKMKGKCAALAFDIEGFFDNLDHKLLKEKWAKILGFSNLPEEEYAVFKSIAHYHYVPLIKIKETFLNKEESLLSKKTDKKSKNKLRKILGKKSLPPVICQKGKDFKRIIRPLIKNNKGNRGIPQGSPISGILANIYLLDFDLKIKEIVGADGMYRRYSDDLIIICKTEKAETLKDCVIKAIEESKLAMQPEKEYIVIFEDSKIVNKKPYLQYLGFEFNGESIFLRSGTNTKRTRKNIQKIKAKYASQNNKDKDKSIKKKVNRSEMGKYNYFKKAEDLMNSDEIKRQNSKFRNLTGRLRKKLNLKSFR